MKIVRQDGIKDCGVCCLLSIIRFYGGDLSLEYLRGVTNTNKSGVSAFDLIEAMKKIGFDAYGVTGDLEKIEFSNLPCIAHLIINKKYKHFVVIYSIDDKKRKVVIMDPAVGRRSLSFSQFKLLSSSNYIYLRPIKKLPKMSNKHIINKFIKHLLKCEKISLLFIFLIKYNNLLDTAYSLSFMEQILNLVKAFFSDILFVVIWGFGSYLVIIKKLSLGKVLVYQNIFTYFFNSFNSLITIFNNYHSFKVAAFRIEDLFLIDGEEFTGSYYYLSHRLDGDISFNKLSYSISNRTILKGLSLNIKCGEKILLLGKSGAGKSTLVKILLRYIDIPFGYVSIKGIDINHYHLEVIRQGITFVSSNELLFTNTLYNNIVLGREVNYDDFINICKICMVDEIVDDDLGYQVLVEENGFNFSNGEKQRIILARALLRKSDIYIFDEAFSQIDRGRRNIIIKNIFEYLKEKTIVVISHNIENRDIFNRVLKMEDGEVFEA